MDVIDVFLQLRVIAQGLFLEARAHCASAANPRQQGPEQTPPHGTRVVAGGQRENEVQMIWQDHAGRQRKWMPLATRAERQPQQIDIVGECGRALFFQRGSDEVLGRSLFDFVHGGTLPWRSIPKHPPFGRCKWVLVVPRRSSMASNYGNFMAAIA